MEQEKFNRELKNMGVQIGFGCLFGSILFLFIYIAMLLATLITGVY